MMKSHLVLVRGRPFFLPQPHEMMLSFGLGSKASPLLSNDAVLVEVSATQVIWQQSGTKRPLPLVFESRRQICQLPGGESLILWKQPWWVELTLSDFEAPTSTRLFLPFQGWDDNVWHDGPIALFHENRLRGAVAAGPPGLLRVDLNKDEGAPEGSGLLDFLEQSRGQALKLSLIQAFQSRQKFETSGVFHIVIEKWTARTAALLILLRASYPENGFYLDAKATLPSAGWKRLCQNLDIQAPSRSRERVGESLEYIVLEDLWPLGEDEALKFFLRALQKKVPVIPAQLLTGLTSA